MGETKRNDKEYPACQVDEYQLKEILDAVGTKWKATEKERLKEFGALFSKIAPDSYY